MADTLLAPLPTTLSDGLVSLRLITPDDWPLEVGLSAVPDVVRWTRYPPDLDEAGARARIETRVQGAVAGTGGRYVVRTASGSIVGNAGIAMNAQHLPEVFYALLPAGRGLGLATAATRLLTGWALGAGHRVVVLNTISGNTASEAVARRAGFLPTALESATVRDTQVQVQRWERSTGPGVH